MILFIVYNTWTDRYMSSCSSVEGSHRSNRGGTIGIDILRMIRKQKNLPEIKKYDNDDDSVA